MYNRYLLGLALLVAGTMPTFSQVSDDNEDGVVKMNADRSRYDFVEGQVLVKFKDESPVKVSKARGMVTTNVGQLTSILEKYGANEMEKVLPNEKPGRQLRKSRAFNGETIQEKDLSRLYCVKLGDSHRLEVLEAVKELKNLKEVEFAEPNYRLYVLDDTTIDGFSGGNPFAASQWYLEDYGVTKLWNKPIINKKRPVIAILDTGVDITHPDLVDNLWTNAGEDQGVDGYDNDGNGFKNDLHGWDFINNTANVRDFNAHGTHVAGIAAASNNGLGIVGANPKALIMPVTIMQSDGTGDVATIIKGINYAVANGATILNMSLGTYANSRALRQALENAYQSTVIVAAAGNDGKCINTPHHPKPCYGAAPMFPAAYSFVLGVQATTQGGDLASFSNYDDDGPNFSATSTLQDPDGFNYELKAPGTAMYSTLPGGKYGNLNGTSMAAPLVAGAISALKMVKQYDTQEILWGDLLHTSNIAQAYAVTNRPAELDLMKIMYRERKELSEETEEDYSGDGRIDAGETVSLYPVIRTTFGEASNIKMKLEMGDEFEDPNTVQILTPDWVDFGMHLDAYGKGVSFNPMLMKVADNVANGRHIKMKFTAKCDETNMQYIGNFTIVVDNTTKIGGVIVSDLTLTADKEWLVTKNIAIVSGATLSIEPGTTLRFADYTGISVADGGHLICHGTPEKQITFTKGASAEGKFSGLHLRDNVLEYTTVKDFIYYDAYTGSSPFSGTFQNCVFRNNYDYAAGGAYPYIFGGSHFIKSNIFYNYVSSGFGPGTNEKSNIIGNTGSDPYSLDMASFCSLNAIKKCNIFDFKFGNYGDIFWGNTNTTPATYHTEYPSYFGSSKESIVRKGIWDVNHENGYFGYLDLTNMLTKPCSEAHGIVWKVCVNSKDAQDEYEDLAPLGVGKHKFEVYFNRPMNKEVVPQISFGLREPYTQNAVAEDGSWNEEGTIYTAYKTIDGKTKSDGLNRIYVHGAEDNEFFEIPYEKTRFNIIVQAAGSMATGFSANAGLGRVNLTWDNSNNNFDDAMGFNVYRYGSKMKTIPAHYDNNGNWVGETQVPDTVRLNENILDVSANSFVDYEVTPGETYYYYYKVLSTGLQEYDISNVVAATPLTSTLGDANGSGDVNVTDVVWTVNYAVGMDPKPFIFEAADVNKDLAIDILDVVGIVNLAMSASSRAMTRDEAAQAIYTIEDGILYVETPVSLAGLQVQFSLDKKKEMKAADGLNGFEQASTWLTDNDYMLMAYSFGKKALDPGKHALLYIGDAELTDIRMSDVSGRKVMAVAGSGITAIDGALLTKTLNRTGIYNLKGQKVAGNAEGRKLQRGVYIINGQKIVK